MLELLWLIPILPLAGAAINGLLGTTVPEGLVTAVGVGAPLASLARRPRLPLGVRPRRLPHDAYEQVLYAWTTGELAIPVAFLLDPLSAVMLFIVTCVGFLIHVYSVGYMAHEEGYRRYFAYLNLFMSAMLMLVLGSNYLVMFVGWEGVGLCSYLLIGFYYDQNSPPAAGKKAFIVNRIGDFGFLLGMFLLFANFGSARLSRASAADRRRPGLVTARLRLGMPLAIFVALCFFVGAMGKSAQIPLYVWLPDAMAGPTPVSALIHAATMVTAGVYMVVRSNVLYRLAPGVSLFVAIIGARDGALRGDDRPRADRHQEGARLLDRLAARLHVPGGGVGAYSAAIFHVDDARLLQGLPLPRLRLGDPRHGRRAGHAEDGRPAEVHAVDLLHVR